MAIPVYIFANQRSGTNLLRNAMVSTGDFTDLNEIFQPNEPHIYWSFYSNYISNNPECIVPTVENMNRIFDAFQEQCIEPVQSRYALIDVKYNSAHNLNCQFQSPSEAPYLFELIKKNECKVIHLIRENMFENYVSNQLANQTRQYCAFDGDEIRSEQIVLSADQTIMEIKKCEANIKKFTQFFVESNYKNFMEISYTELTRLNDSSDIYMKNKLKEFFQLSNINNIEVRTRKIALPPSAVISNYKEEILPALLNTPYARFAH